MATAALAWAGSSFASGALSAAGGMAFERVIAVLGIMEDPTQKMREQLTEINLKLDSVVRDIGIINARISALATQLELTKLKLYERIEAKAVSPASSLIQTHFTGSPIMQTAAKLQGEPDPGPVTTLTELLGRKIDGRLTEKTVKAFMEHILITWDIRTAVNEIYSALVGDSSDDGILRTLTDLFIAQMGTGSMDPKLLQFYESLEQRFISLIAIQLQGVYLVMMAKCHGEPPETIPSEANDYLHNVFVRDTLMREIDLFLSCTEKLVLSQGQWRSPSPIATNAMKEVRKRPVLVGGMGVPTDLSKILLRSELIGRRLIETFRDMRDFPDPDKRRLGQMDALMRSSGIYVHLLCSETDVVKGEGPELKPWPSGASKGRSLPATGVRVPVWEGSTEGFVRLKRLDGSNLRLVRYFWPWYQIRGPGEPNFANGKAFNQILLSDADLAKMGIDWKGLQAGHTIDTARLRLPVMTAAEASAAAWTVSPLAGADKYTSGQLITEAMDKPLLVPAAAKAFYRAGFTLKGTQTFDVSGTNPRSVSATMTCPLFSYEDDEVRKLKVHLWMSLFANRNLTNCINFQMGARVMVKLKTPQSDLELYDSNRSDSGQLNLWNAGRQSGQAPQAGDEPVLTFTVEVGKTPTVEKYSLIVTAQVLHQGYCPGATADVQASIKELSVSWIAAEEDVVADGGGHSRETGLAQKK